MIGSYASPLAEASNSLLMQAQAAPLVGGGARPMVTPRPYYSPPRFNPQEIPPPANDPLPSPTPNVRPPGPSYPPPATQNPPDSALNPNANPDEEMWPEASSERHEEGDLAEYRRRRKRRKKHCCEPQLFPQWAKEQPNKVTDPKMGASLSWKDRIAPQKGFTYQYCMYGNRSEFNCEGGGTDVDADMSFPDRCWIGDAKYTENAALRLLPERAKDFIQRRIYTGMNKDDNDLFDRYGKVTRQPDALGKECWNIGLQVLVNEKGDFVEYFKSLMNKYDIEGQVLYRPMRESCKVNGTDGSGPDDPPKRDWWEQDHTYDPSYMA